jgi:hypothetical protein
VTSDAFAQRPRSLGKAALKCALLAAGLADLLFCELRRIPRWACVPRRVPSPPAVTRANRSHRRRGRMNGAGDGLDEHGLRLSILSLRQRRGSNERGRRRTRDDHERGQRADTTELEDEAAHRSVGLHRHRRRRRGARGLRCGDELRPVVVVGAHGDEDHGGGKPE